MSGLAAKFFGTMDYGTRPRAIVLCSGWLETCVLEYEGLALQVEA